MPIVLGVFDNTTLAHGAVEQLIAAGIERDDISMLSRDPREPNHGEEPSGAAAGAGVGAALGSAGGLLAGVAGLAIPGLGPMIAAGPLAAALAGALGGAGVGAAAGGLIGALTDMGVPSDEAKYYEDQLSRGRTLVAVRAVSDDAADRAADILEAYGANEVEGRASEPASERPTTMPPERNPVFGREADRPGVVDERREPGRDRSHESQPGRIIAAGERRRVQVYLRDSSNPAGRGRPH